MIRFLKYDFLNTIAYDRLCRCAAVVAGHPVRFPWGAGVFGPHVLGLEFVALGVLGQGREAWRLAAEGEAAGDGHGVRAEAGDVALRDEYLSLHVVLLGGVDGGLEGCWN